MKDFFRFRSELLEGKKEQKHKDKSKELTELDKDEDDPCWDGYVQLGTKMKNGKEVPNCVPIEEAQKKSSESALNERLDNKYFVVKKERGKTLYFYLKGSGGRPDWTDNPELAYVLPDEEYAQGVAKQFGGEVQKGLREAMSEDTTVEVSPRDARKANDIASDMFRGEYENDGSNTFVFDDDETADEFRAELEKQRIELLEETKPKSGDREAYKKFFNKTLKKFGADSLADLDDDKQKEFFNYVDKNWESEDEKD